jgi:hypothetical protein
VPVEISKVPAIGSIILLLLAVFGRWPYGFYTVLRLAVCLSALYLATYAFRFGKALWAWVLVGTAILFNPLVPVRLGRSEWQPLDLIGAAIFVVCLKTIRGKD